MMTWLEDDKRLGVGTRLTLKGDDTVWTVDKSYGEVRSDPPAKEWKVGGLV